MKRRTLVALGITALSGALAGPGVAVGATKPPTAVNAAFGSGLSINLSKGQKAKNVSEAKATLKAGTYKLTLKDTANVHNFVLEKAKPGTINPFSPKVVKATNGKPVQTSVSEVKTRAFQVKLAKGTYTLYCAPHAGAGMWIQITVT